MRLLVIWALCAAGVFGQSAEKFNHVKWTMTVGGGPDAAVAVLKAEIDPGWHMYSPSTPPGPIPTTIKLVDSPGVTGFTIFEPAPIRKFDPNFNAETETYEGAATFYVRLQLKKGADSVTFEPRYQTCSGTSCIPPRTRRVSAKVETGAAPAIPAGYSEVKRGQPTPSAPETTGLLGFLAVAFGVGLAAIFTPCVFPMIPITMSYFVGQKGGIGQAVTFCLGIIALFTGLGLVLATSVVQFGGSPWVNGFI
ncbi:MAG: redoxin, partial [Acidobacteriota bacterium]|nr:redoxin [Acidobacteriota bacterium]